MPLFVEFGSFLKNQYNLYKVMKKCPSRIRYLDLNPRPLEQESSPITTRPGLPPNLANVSGWTFRIITQIKGATFHTKMHSLNIMGEFWKIKSTSKLLYVGGLHDPESIRVPSKSQYQVRVGVWVYKKYF